MTLSISHTLEKSSYQKCHHSGVLSQQELSAIKPFIKTCYVNSGERVTFETNDSLHFCILLKGEACIVNTTSNSVVRAHESLDPGEIVGLLSFFKGEPATQYIRAISDCEIAIVTDSIYRGLFTSRQGIWHRLQIIGLHLKRMQRFADSLNALFGPFNDMLPFVVRDLETEINWLSLTSGQTLITQGDKADCTYILVTGRLQIATTLSNGRELFNEVVQVGEPIGETAMLTQQVHSHSVYALRESEVVQLPRRCFELMLLRNTKAIHNITRILGNRFTQSTDRKHKSSLSKASFCLLGANGETYVDSFSKRLVKEFSVYGQTEVVTSHKANAQLHSPDIAQCDNNQVLSLKLLEWLNNKELDSQFLIYEAEQQSDSKWNARCVSQSDQIIVVAQASSEPDLSSLQSVLNRPRQYWSLVLLHPEGTDRPRNTAKWFTQCQPNAVYHVRDNNQKDVARLARILTGNGVSLVLGGGGARGFAHLGVIKALEELDVPVDLICGSSMGAPIAGMIAQGATADEVATRSKEAYHKIIDYTLPLVSLIAGKRISKTIKEQTQGWNIEDYWLPFFCVSTNLTTALPVVHQRGDAWLAIRSSVSIPGVLPPVPYNEQLLVDGGVLNNLPVDIMREFNPSGTIIAIDVAPPVGPRAKSDYGTDLSGWKQLCKQVLPWFKAPSVPTMASTIMQAMVAGSALKRQEILEQVQADLYLNIHVRGVGMLQFNAIDKAKKVGYESSICKLKSYFPIAETYNSKSPS